MKTVTTILAGGQSRRMGGRDKALAVLKTDRLIDWVVAAIKPQTEILIISGHSDYGAGLIVVEDVSGAPPGPAAGVYSVWKWLASKYPDIEGFFTVPVDCPFPPDDLVRRLRSAGRAAIAVDDDGAHPTFAFWPVEKLESAFQHLNDQRSVSLKSLAAACAAVEVYWPGCGRFANLNTPAQLASVSAAKFGNSGG